MPSSYMDTIRRVIESDYKDATDAEKEAAVTEVIQLCSAAASAVTVQPLPFVDIALLSPIQIVMVQAIGRVHGHTLDTKGVLEILSSFGASIVAQGVIMTAARFVPFFGWLVSISMAYALTYAIGEVSDYYFRHGRGVPAGDLKDMFDRVYKDKKKEKEKSHGKNTTLKQRLDQLKEAFKEGLLTQEEFDAKKEEILRQF